MPRVPKKTIKETIKFISKGSGITDGLELWFSSGRIILTDTGSKFKEDVTVWNEPSKPTSTSLSSTA